MARDDGRLVAHFGKTYMWIVNERGWLQLLALSAIVETARAVTHALKGAVICQCCGETEGVGDGVAVDEASGLCLYCQPCPWCGRQGTDCRPESGGRGCDPQDGPDGTPCPPEVERQVMRS